MLHQRFVAWRRRERQAAKSLKKHDIIRERVSQREFRARLFGELIVLLRKSPPQELTDAEVPTSRFCRVFCCCLHFEREQLNFSEAFLRGPALLHLDETLCFVERVPTRKLTADPRQP